MTSLADVRPESERIDFLLRRDGFEATRKWVELTAGLYKAALAGQRGYGSDPIYRPRLEKAVREFEEWLRAISEQRNGHTQPGARSAPTQA
ncbi:MAG: hypothetical protein ACRETZ_08350 [Steroidobacteraceae bacterium]